MPMTSCTTSTQSKSAHKIGTIMHRTWPQLNQGTAAAAAAAAAAAQLDIAKQALVAGPQQQHVVAPQQSQLPAGPTPFLTWWSSRLFMLWFTRVQVSIRPTMSVVLTPSVRLICISQPPQTNKCHKQWHGAVEALFLSGKMQQSVTVNYTVHQCLTQSSDRKMPIT